MEGRKSVDEVFKVTIKEGVEVVKEAALAEVRKRVEECERALRVAMTPRGRQAQRAKLGRLKDKERELLGIR